MKRLVIIFSILLCWFNSNTAQASYTFPLPYGKYVITNDTADHDHYQPWDDFSLDFQAAEIPIQENTTIEQARCWSYGAPILASQNGTVTKVTPLANRHNKADGYGAHVQLRHQDGSIGIYAHMINDSNRLYVKKGDRVEAGQIIGLMGDTGNVSNSNENNPCHYDNNYGTHLHYELRNNPSEPSFRKTKGAVQSSSRADDKDALYAQHHFGKYPNIPQLEQVHSITPLQAKPGDRTQFLIKGRYLYEDSHFEFPFCNEFQQQRVNVETIAVDCLTREETSNYPSSFPNLHQKNGQLQAIIELSNTPNNKSEITDVSFIPPKAGETLELSITGSNLGAELNVSIQAQSDHSDQGRCQGSEQFSQLSSTEIIVRCQLPLDLGPVNQQNPQLFDISITKHNDVLYQSTFEVNYGISSPRLAPLQATVGVPTRFTISGKNVHRSQIFFIEYCAEKDFKVIDQQYDRVTFECTINPTSSESSTHRFFFKTRSRYNEDGQDSLTDAEDEANTILSGYITVIHDPHTHIDSIRPQTAVIGEETIFTVTGNRLPYSSEKIPLVWLANCPGYAGPVDVIPETYTPNRFQFRCTPQLTDEEQTAYLQLEQRSDTDSRTLKKQLWSEFDRFFEELEARQLHIKSPNKQLVSEQSVRFISDRYRSIQREERFQHEYLREDRTYVISGPAVVHQLEVGPITRSNRHQEVIIRGENLSYSTALQSDDCAQIATTLGSSEEFRFVCLLKKVAVEELQLIDANKQEELFRHSNTVIEVYTAEAFQGPEHVEIDITGVHLNSNILINSPDCDSLQYLKEPTSSQLFLRCKTPSGEFSQPQEIQLSVASSEGIQLFDASIPIVQSRSKKRHQTGRTDNIKKIARKSPKPDKRFLYPDIQSPVLRSAVTELTQQGQLETYANNRFDAETPFNEIPKDQFIAQLMRQQAFYLTPSDKRAALEQYKDLSPNSNYLEEITFAFINDLLPKTPQLKPSQPFSRGEAALLLHQLAQLQQALVQLRDPPPQTSPQSG